MARHSNGTSMTSTIARMAILPTLLLATLATAERLPATFEHADKSLQSLIEFPELRGDTSATLLCASQVSSSGKMQENGCFVNAAGDEVFIRVILTAAKKARMTPARVDGKAIAVYVQFRVEFKKTGDEQSVRIMNNPGLEENVAAYGDEHIAAQRGLTSEQWLKICPKQVHFNLLAKAHVAADGQQSSISISPGEGVSVTARCTDAILGTLRESVFTPAYADGVAVPSSFIEPFSS